MKRTRIAVRIVLAAIVVGWASAACQNSEANFSGKLESIRIGIPPNEQSTLLLIAEDQHLFAQNGLDATVKIYDTALAALEGLKKGEVDVSESAEFPIVRESFKKETLSIIASIDKFQGVHLVGRKDRGIENISDLKGKKIGSAQGTLTEFYLGRFLELHGMKQQDVTIVNLPFSQSADALANGSVDAFQVQFKDIPLIQRRLGNNLVMWQSQNNQAGYEVISGRRDWIASHPEAIRRLLKALDQAAEYSLTHSVEAMAIVQKRLNYDDAYLDAMQSNHQYSLTLDRSLVAAMEDEARWMISNNLTTEKQVPDFLDYIYMDGLKAIKPNAVNIIR